MPADAYVNWMAGSPCLPSSRPQHSQIEMSIFSLSGPQQHPMFYPQSFSEMHIFYLPKKEMSLHIGGRPRLFKSKHTYLVPEALRQKAVLFSCPVTEFGLQRLHFYFIFPLKSQGRAPDDHTPFVKIGIQWTSRLLGLHSTAQAD